MSFQEQPDLSAFRIVECGRNLKNGGFARNDFMDLSQLSDYRQKHENIGLYNTAFIYDGPDPNEANLYGNFYLDFDAEDDISKSQLDAQIAIWNMRTRFTFDLPEEAFRIYFSGSKGFHVVVPAKYFGYHPNKNLNGIFKLIAKDLAEQCPNGTLDTKIYDKRRLMRMANSKHPKTGLFKIPLTYAELTKLTPDEIRAKASRNYVIRFPEPTLNKNAHQHFIRYEKEFEDRFTKVFENRERHEGKPLDFTPACIQNLLDEGPVSGQRNQTACVLTSFFKNQGLTQEETWYKLTEWNQGALGEEELRNTMLSIWNRNMAYGCSTLETISICVQEKCPLFKPRKP